MSLFMMQVVTTCAAALVRLNTSGAEGLNTNEQYQIVQEANWAEHVYKQVGPGSSGLPEIFPGESRSAEVDKEGNWGELVSGYRLSLRFRKSVFSVGEPINGMIIARNESTNGLPFLELFGSGYGYGAGSDCRVCDFEIIDKEGTKLPAARPMRSPMGKAIANSINAKSQIRYWIPLCNI